jgi:hypothetical protein
MIEIIRSAGIGPPCIMRPIVSSSHLNLALSAQVVVGWVV